jgi:hypothetical protein
LYNVVMAGQPGPVIHVFATGKGVDARHKATAVRHIFCLKRRTALILLGSRRFAIVWTRKDQHRAASK